MGEIIARACRAPKATLSAACPTVRPQQFFRRVARDVSRPACRAGLKTVRRPENFEAKEGSIIVMKRKQ
jgi:hypothetical protein